MKVDSGTKELILQNNLQTVSLIPQLAQYVSLNGEYSRHDSP